MTSKATSFRIERKTFSLAADPRIPNHYRLTEATNERSYTLTLSKEALSWLKTCFSKLCDLSLSQKFFNETRVAETVIWVEKISNKKGHSTEIAKLGQNGGINKLIVPMGKERKGWRSLIATINALTTPINRVINAPLDGKRRCNLQRSFKEEPKSANLPSHPRSTKF